MGCLFALLGALSSFTVVQMPRSNLSLGCMAFPLGKGNKESCDILHSVCTSECMSYMRAKYLS